MDLLDQNSTRLFFEIERPEYVIVAAAKVGGILANSNYPVDFILQNLLIQNNLISYSNKYKVKKLIFLGSACIYPKNAKQPIKENYLLSGYLEETNSSYSIAKIAGIKLCESYYRQYGDNFISLMPNNLYGFNDNYNKETSHVIPSLIQKFHNAKKNKKRFVEVWGSGKPLREFVHSDDLADAILFIMQNIDADNIYSRGISHLNIGSGEEIKIKDLAFLIKEITNFKGDIIFDNSKPDGTPRKLLDTSLINKFGWASKISLEKGLKSTYLWYINNHQAF